MKKRTYAWLTAAAPRVHTFGTTWPATLSDHRTVAILVLVSAQEDPLDTQELDVTKLIEGERKVAVRVSPTRLASERTAARRMASCRCAAP